MRYAILFLLAVTCAAASAQVYQRTNPDGQVEFSDRPGPDAEPVDVAPAQTITVTPAPARPSRQAGRGTGEATAEAPTPGYDELRIVSPSPDEGVRANDGNITVQVSLAPALQTGHTIWVDLAGEAGVRTASSRSTALGFTELERGRYTATARVVDRQGATLVTAEPVGFNVLRAFVRRSPR